MPQSDRDLVCVSCGRSFVFSSAEQALFAERGFQEPRRCRPCRAARKAEGGQDRPAHGGPRRDDARGRGGPQQNRPQPNRGFGGRNGSPDPQRFGEKMPRPEDPNGYRAPGFTTSNNDPHVIDYAGLPKDEDEDVKAAEAATSARDGQVDRFGMRTSAPSSFGSYTRRRAPQGGPGRSSDRGGTDPNAYRSPAFSGSAHNDPRGRANDTRRNDRKPRAPRALFDVTCAQCGAAAKVPFEPSAERPAYCKSCFDAKRAERPAAR